jgi:hypothetical protein
LWSRRAWGFDSAYWGRIIASMTLMAAGLALTTSPVTDAIMGAVLPGKAGAGSAVNDTTRELGVAVVGSVMASVYGTHVLRSLTSLGAPAAAAAAAGKSVVAGLTVAAHLPHALQDMAAQAARQAFVDGLSAGSLVAAAGTAVAAVAALAFLPGRAKKPPPGGTPAPVQTGTDGQARPATDDARLHSTEIAAECGRVPVPLLQPETARAKARFSAGVRSSYRSGPGGT